MKVFKTEKPDLEIPFIEGVIDQMLEDAVFEDLIIWADTFDIPHNEDEWFDDEYPDRQSELIQKITQELLKAITCWITRDKTKDKL